MIQDKEKVEKIYNYLSNLDKAHKSSANKYNGWTLYNKNDKKLGFSVQKYSDSYSDIDRVYRTRFYLYDVNFNYKSGFLSSENNYERIYIDITVSENCSGLEINQCQIKDGANLISFFSKLDEFVNSFEAREFILEKLLLSKIGENK